MLKKQASGCRIGKEGVGRCSVVAAVLTIGVLFQACDRGRETGTPVPPGPETGEVKIVPEGPRVTDTLSALFQGPKQALYRWSRNGQALEGADGPRLPASAFSKGDTIAVSVTADGKTVSASVVIENSLPVITDVRLDPPEVHAGKDLRIVTKVSDADGDRVDLQVEWRVNGEFQQERGMVLSGGAFRRGDSVSVRIVPMDEDGYGEAFEGVPLTIPNAPPVIVTTPAASFSEAGYQYAARAADPDGDAVVYSLTAGPQGMMIDSSTGVVSWRPDSIQAGDHTVEIEAKDSEGMRATQRYVLTVNPQGEVQP